MSDKTILNELIRDYRHLNASLKEAIQDVIAPFSRAAANSVMDGFTPSQYPLLQNTFPPVGRDSVQRGEQIPVYDSSQGLKVIRDNSRVTCYFNEFALCGIENRANYTMGDNGLKHTAQPVNPKDSGDVELAKYVNDFIDIFSEVNDLPNLERNGEKKADIDGDCFIRLFDHDSIPDARFVQPEHVYTAVGDSNPNTSFGINTRPNDIGTPVSYNVIEDPYRINTTTEVPASEMVHIKYNTIDGKRGIPTFYPVEGNLRRCEDLLASMTTMAKVRAKIALLVKMTGVAQSQAQAMVDKLAKVKITDPYSTDQLSVENLPPGSIIRHGGNQDYVFPPHTIGASDFVEVLQAELRAIASRLQMSEWMFTALADAKYSNALVAEAPALRAFKYIQTMWSRNIGSNRYKWRASLIWKAIKIAIKNGVLPKDVLTRVKIVTSGPPIETRNPLQDAQVDEMYLRMGIKTKEQIQKERGLEQDEQSLYQIPVEIVEKLMVVSQNVKSGAITPQAGKVLIKLMAKLKDEDIQLLLAV